MKISRTGIEGGNVEVGRSSFFFFFFTCEIVNLEVPPEEFSRARFILLRTVSIIPLLNILGHRHFALDASLVIFPDKEIVSAEFQMEIFKNLYILRER